MIKPLNEQAKLMLCLLEETSFSEDIRTYSGRGMSGRVCLSVEMDRGAQLFELGYEIARAVYAGSVWANCSIVPVPQFDSMGKGVIAYWPAAQVEEMESQEE